MHVLATIPGLHPGLAIAIALAALAVALRRRPRRHVRAMAALEAARRELDARSRYLSTIIESEPECVKTVAADGALIEMNPAGLAMIEAASMDEVRGSLVEDLLHPDWVEPFAEMHNAVIGGEARTLEFQLVGLKGSTLWMETHAVPLVNSEGSTVHLAITRDITRRKDQEADLLEARNRAETASRTKTEFLANMSHELRTPLTAILGYAELLTVEGASDADHDRGLRAIHGSADHLLALISDILDISKIEANRLEFEALACRPGQLAREVTESMRARATERNTTLVVEIDDTAPNTVRTDPLRVRQVLANLIGNAIKFTKDGSIRIEISASTLEGEQGSTRLEFRVVDTGIGIRPEALDQLFTPFSQADSSTTRCFGGTGLGLTISRRLARLLGGDVTVESVIGQGSTFTFELLLDADDVDPDVGRGLEDANPPAPLPTPTDLSGKFEGRILLVEDNPVNRLVLRKMLERLGLTVEDAQDGREGYQMATSSMGSGEPYDLVLLDMHMPVLDGYKAAGMLRDEGFAAPIVALTASAMSNDRARCLAAGCDDYASKPIQIATLRALLARHLDSVKPERARRQGSPVSPSVALRPESTR